jgi:lysophospholipase L1-like esterase
MSRKSLITATIAFTQMLFVQFVQAQENILTIGLIGDSTVATTYGWGPAFASGVKDHVKVLNYAKNGATLDSLSKKLDALLKAKPDYVIIQFGHNDMKRYDAKIYGEKLKRYVERVRNAGSKPIIFSSVTRRVFDENGKIKPKVYRERILPTYALSAKAVAKETKTSFLDLNTISIEHHNKIGPGESATYDFRPNDQTHFSKIGAKEIANLIIKELKATVPELAVYLQ